MATFALSPVGASVNGIELYSLELDVSRDVETFDDESLPDPTWTFTDAEGHFFAWDADGKLHNLTKRNIAMECDDSCGGTCDGAGYVKVVRECMLCGAPVEPGMRRGTRTIPGETLYVAHVTGPVRLAALDGETVSFVCAEGFGFGRLDVREVVYSNATDSASVVITIATLYRRYGTRAQRREDVKRANLTRAILAGAEAVRKPWEDLPEAERAGFVRDFATLAASRAITAALPHLGLNEDGEVLP